MPALHLGIGRASGENRAIQAAQQAIESPLLEVSIDGARGILFNVIGGNDVSMHEINTAAETITAAADPDANIIFGASINQDIDMDITKAHDDLSGAEEFHKETEIPNIWSLDHDEGHQDSTDGSEEANS